MFQINVPHFLCHDLFLFLGLCCCTEHMRKLQQADTKRITGMRKATISKHANKLYLMIQTHKQLLCVLFLRGYFWKGVGGMWMEFRPFPVGVS